MATTSTSPRTLASPRRWVEPAARTGYATKGLLYMLIGGLAIASVVGAGGAVGGAETATRYIESLPFGEVLLALVGIGMFAYAAWRFTQALLDPQGLSRKTGAKGLAKRAGYAIGGLAHAAIGLAAIQLAFGDHSGGTGERTWIAQLLRWDGGPILVILAGAGLVLFALWQIFRAWTSDVARELKVTEMTTRQRRWAVRAGRAGLFARGVVFTLIGSGLVQAGIDVRPGEARGLSGALHDVAAQPQGAALLLIVAAGLFAYGVHQMFEARFRRIPAY